MKFDKKRIERIILEELKGVVEDKNLDEGVWDRVKASFSGMMQGPIARALHTKGAASVGEEDMVKQIAKEDPELGKMLGRASSVVRSHTNKYMMAYEDLTKDFEKLGLAPSELNKLDPRLGQGVKDVLTATKWLNTRMGTLSEKMEEIALDIDAEIKVARGGESLETTSDLAQLAQEPLDPSQVRKPRTMASQTRGGQDISRAVASQGRGGYQVPIRESRTLTKKYLMDIVKDELKNYK
tara:strand:+ start:2025 stop:2741 length:717 start_codon:yes stop_codon:yes gene_type:complete